MSVVETRDRDSLLDAFIGRLALDGRLIRLHHLPGRPPRFGVPGAPLADELLDRVGVSALWSHQAEAIDRIRAGHSVVVASGTASGKSLCYLLPIAEAATRPLRPGTAIAVFPTKALAHDQLRSFANLDHPGVVAATYDGDSDGDERAWARRCASVILTNPEMLHSGVLPHHHRWATFLSRLRYVVVDELHAFRGVFGSHVGHVLRRLRRLAAHYGADPTFVLCSATIGDPARLASALTGLAVEAITDDGSPQGDRLVALWNPPLLDDLFGPPGERRGARWRPRSSPHSETAALLTELVAAGHGAIGFCRSRRTTELVAADVRRRLPADLADRVRPYRAGYLAAERREIEAELAEGALRAIVATSALELGIDIGALDACVIDGFPGTVSSLRQQMGRVGRDRQTSLAVLVAGEDQLDQWLVAHPDEVFNRPAEPAVINVANPNVFHPHLRCAAFELPLTPADERWWPGLLDDGVRDLVRDGEMRVRAPHGRRREPTAYWTGRGFPSHGVGLRSAGAGEFRIVLDDDDATLVGTVDESRACETVHPGAVYLHRGRGYRVSALDLHGRRAIVEPFDEDELTVPRTEIRMAITGIEQVTASGNDLRICLGTVVVSSQVTAFQRRRASSGSVLGTEPLDLPPSHLVTRALWWEIGDRALEGAGLDTDRWPGTLHAAEHAAIGMLPLFAICDRWDVGGISTIGHADTGHPTVMIYDGVPGGAGIAELGFAASRPLLAATREVIAACPCHEGCPSCVQSPKCGNWNEPLDKGGAVALLAEILLTSS